MRREFRGRNYRVEYNLPILQISEVINKKRSNPDIVFEGGELTFWKNMKLNEALGSLSLSDEKVVVNAIRRTILQQYNGNITDEILIHYLYLKKYIKYLKRQTKSGSDEERSIQHAIIDDMRKLMILATPGQHSCNTRTSIPTTSGQTFL